MKTGMKFILAILAAFACFGQNHTLAAEEEPDILSEAAVLMDAKTGKVIYGKNSDDSMYPASLTKIATAIYALEKGHPDDLVTVSKHAREADGTRVYLEEGEKVQLKKLIQGLLVNSGNDAGVAIAEHMDGSEERFADNLNRYVKKLGAKNTHFKNPHGLYDPDHVTTAEDLATMTKYAMKNEEFRHIFSTKELQWEGEAWHTVLFTHHKLMRETPYEGVTGGKTGYTDESGHTLVTTAERDGLDLIAVVLKASSQKEAYTDTVSMLDYGFAHYKTNHIPKGATFLAEGITYTMSKDFYFTQLIKDEVITKVTKKGVLEILDPNQEVVASAKLESSDKDGGKMDKESEVAVEKDFGSVHAKDYGYSIILILVVFGVLLIWKKAARRRKRRGWQ